MPEKSQLITINGSDASAILTIAYGTLEKLEWTIKYAGENILIAYTPGKWNFTGEEITVQANVNELTITSKMVHSESFDLLGKNKKHIQNFSAAFETMKAAANETQISEWNDKIRILKGETIVIAEEELKQAEEVNRVMNLSKANKYVTYGIIAINVLVFIAMIVSGVNFISPAGEDIVNWGGNFLHIQIPAIGGDLSLASLYISVLYIFCSICMHCTR